MPEFGLAPVAESEALGPARNPWDLTRTPGGSTGGSAAAVAARIVPMAHGSDGAGSLRIPASCCGLFGLKPTRGRTPQGPIQDESWHGFSVGHAITRSVRDSAALLDATMGSDVGAPYDISGPTKPFLLASRPLGFKDFEASTYSAGLLGSAWRAADYASAVKYLQAWSRRVGDVFTRYDVLLAPTLAEPPPLIGALKPSSAELTIMNVIGPLKAGWFLKVTGLAKMLSERSLEFIPYTAV